MSSSSNGKSWLRITDKFTSFAIKSNLTLDHRQGRPENLKRTKLVEILKLPVQTRKTILKEKGHRVSFCLLLYSRRRIGHREEMQQISQLSSKKISWRLQERHLSKIKFLLYPGTQKESGNRNRVSPSSIFRTRWRIAQTPTNIKRFNLIIWTFSWKMVVRDTFRRIQVPEGTAFLLAHQYLVD